MKLIDKLANDAVNLADPRLDIREIYKQGFRDARRLMIAKIRAEIGSAGLPTVGADPNLGEEEAANPQTPNPKS